uniref:Secreted protein n=1 Tax=Rhipicephalus appendiculatus TaxID=34631 RepID=A0A131YEZ7_RHIAP
MLCGSANSQFTHIILYLLFFSFHVSPPRICVAQSPDRHVPRTYANNPSPSHSSRRGTRAACHWHEAKRESHLVPTLTWQPKRVPACHHTAALTDTTVHLLQVVDVVHGETTIFRCTEQQRSQQVLRPTGKKKSLLTGKRTPHITARTHAYDCRPPITH